MTEPKAPWSPAKTGKAWVPFQMRLDVTEQARLAALAKYYGITPTAVMRLLLTETWRRLSEKNA